MSTIGIASKAAMGGDHSLIKRAASLAFLIRVGSAGVVYFGQIVLARLMGTSEFGIYAYAWTWVVVIGALADFGLGVASQRFIPEYSERKTSAFVWGYVALARKMALAFATCIAVLGAVLITLAQPWLNHYVVLPLYGACAVLPLFGLTVVQDGISRAFGWVNLALLPPYMVRPALVVGIMVLAVAAGLPADAATAMGAAFVASAVAVGGQWLVLDRWIASKLPRETKAYDRKRWLSAAVPIFIVGGIFTLLTNIDVLVLQEFRPPDEVAVYFAATKTLALVAFVHFSISAAVAHKFAEYNAAGDRAQLTAFIRSAIRWTFWPSLAAIVLMLMFGKPMLWLFGPKFVDGYPLMWILAGGLLARAAVGPVESLLNMLGEQKACAMVYGAACATSLTLCLVLIPRFGLTGAATATSTALVVESILLFLVAKRRLGFHVLIRR
jgi:O-antigen/teichoic acid export membrane protein